MLKIIRNDLTAGELRAEATRTKNPRQARRMLAIAMVLDDHPRHLAAQAGGMDRQTLSDWVHRYNTHGMAGLVDRARSGRKPRLTPAQMSELESWVEDGPDPKKDSVVRWRCADLRDRIKARFCVGFHERSVGKLLKKLDFSNISGRPLHPKSDLAAQEAFKESFAAQARTAIPPAYADRPVEIWFRMKRALASKVLWPASGRSAAHGPGSSVTGGLPGPICSAPSAPPVAPARPWSCPASMSRP